eukprot:10063380-Alexandrium_andersonii.AAC.1
MPPQKARPTLKKPAAAFRMSPKAKVARGTWARPAPAAAPAALPAAGPSAATAAPGPQDAALRGGAACSNG